MVLVVALAAQRSPGKREDLAERRRGEGEVGAGDAKLIRWRSACRDEGSGGVRYRRASRWNVDGARDVVEIGRGGPFSYGSNRAT
jgi:hypothetical protein